MDDQTVSSSDSRNSVEQEPDATRRALLMGGSAAGFAAAIGLPIPYIQNLAPGLIPVALAQQASDETLVAGKAGLTRLGDRPINMETPPHLLDDAVTPANRLFVRNNGQVPDVSEATDENWMLTIDGEVENQL